MNDEADADGSIQLTSVVPANRSHRASIYAAIAYLLLSLILWWNVWTSHPAHTTICGCGDSAKFTWFFSWMAHAITHGLDPFYTTYLYHPHGINLLADTSSTAVGFVLAPVTWAFGPIATLNVALTLSPALSALAMFVLLRRWVTWTPAAFIGGLVYGFSPFVLVSLSSGWVDFALLAIPPLCVFCLDELIFRQRRRPVMTGVRLGLLVVVQFFVGTEVLLMTVGFAGFGVLLIIGFAALRRPDRLRIASRHAIVGLIAAAVTSFVLLAYPAWFALKGPASFSGPVWGGYFEGESSLFRDFFLPTAAHTSSTAAVGYQGPYLSPQYIGIPLLVILVAGLLAWRRDLRLWLFATVAVVATLLSYEHPLGGLPLVQNIIPYRYVLVTYFAVAVMLCLIVQHARDVVLTWSGQRTTEDAGTLGPVGRSPRRLSALVATVVAVVALLPVALYEVQTVPLTAQPIILPNWFRTIAPHVGPGQVLLVLPVQYISGESPLTWQAMNGFPYKMAEEGGPAGVYIAGGRLRAGATAIGIASTGIPYFNHFTSGDVTATRAALQAWGVTKVVIPDQPSLPAYDRVASVPLGAALMTAATGQLPIHEANAWVWNRVGQSSRSAVPTSTSMAECVAGSGHEVAGTVERVTTCVLAASTQAPTA